MSIRGSRVRIPLGARVRLSEGVVLGKVKERKKFKKGIEKHYEVSPKWGDSDGDFFHEETSREFFELLKEPLPIPTQIRVRLNRPLTHAEAEDIRHRGVHFELSVSQDRQHVYAEGAMASRRMFPIVAKVLAGGYVNLFPRAVYTASEYSGPQPPN